MNPNLASPKMKKPTAGRGTGRPRTKVPQNSGPVPQQAQALGGLYQNDQLVNSVTSLLGCVAQVNGKSGKQFEGVFKTISPEGSMVLGKASQVEEQHQNGVVDSVKKKKVNFEQFVMNKKDWVSVEFKNVDLEECYVKKDVFKTDSAITKKINGTQKKELEKWIPSGEVDGSLDTSVLEISHAVTNGWSAEQMFDINTRKYGVKSTYNEDMEEYTTKLEKSDTAEYREKEKIAAQKAEEITKDSPYERNIDGGRSEEALYSSVVRNRPERQTPQNWRNPNPDRPDRDQRSQKVIREGSSSPAMTKREPVKSVQVSEASIIQEKVIKQETEAAVESKPEFTIEVSTDKLPGSKPLQNVTSTKPEPNTTKPVATEASVKVPTEVSEGPVVPPKSPVITPTPAESKTKVIKDLKDFGNNFQLPEEKNKKNKGKKAVEQDEIVSKEKKNEDKEEPPPAQVPKVDVEPNGAEKIVDVKSTLNPNAQVFRPVIQKSPSPISTPSNGGTSSPYPNPPQYAFPPHQPGGVYARPMHRGRAPRGGEYMEHGNFMNASNATGQPFYAQPQYVHQPPTNIFIPHGNLRHPGMQHHPVFLQTLPMGPPGQYDAQVYYGHNPMQMIQSPPQITSPSLQQHHFNFPQSVPLTSQPVNAAVRPAGQPQHQQVFIMRSQAGNEMQPTQIMAQNRPPPAQNFQGN